MNRKLAVRIALLIAVSAALALALEYLLLWSDPPRFERTMLNGNRSVLNEVELSFVDSELAGGTVTPTGGDPQMRVDRLEGMVRKVTFSFGEPLLEGTACQLFYPDGYGNLSEECSVTVVAEAGQAELLFDLPTNHYPFLRLDIDGAFSLRDISFDGTHILKTPVSGSLSASRMAVLFAVLLLPSAYFIFRKKKKTTGFFRDVPQYFSRRWKTVLAAAAILAGASLIGFFGGKLYCSLSKIPFNGYKGAFFVIVGFSAGLLWLLRKRPGTRPEGWFLVISLSAGLALAFLMPVTTVVTWDDSYHYERALELSYFGNMKITQADQDMIEASYPTTFDMMKAEKQNQALDRAYEEGVFVDETVDAWSYRSFGYIPAAFGLWLGRLLQLPFSFIVRMGRAMSLFAYVLVIFLGIRRMKSGRVLASVAALLPTALFQAANYTYDSWLSAFVFFGTAWLIGELQAPERKLRARDCLVMLAAFFVGLGPKPIYFPLMLVLLLMPREKFATGRNLALYRAAVVAASLVVLSMYLVPTVTNDAVTMSDTRGGEDVNGREQIAFILNNPLEYTGILLKFLWNFLSLEMASGYTVFFAYLGMGQYHILVLVLLFLSAFTDRNEYDRFLEGRFKRGWTLLVLFAAVCLMATGMYIYYTPVGMGSVNGCQPRYLLPLVFPFIAFLLNSRVRNRPDPELYNALMYLAVAFVLYSNIWTLIVGRYV